MSVGVLLTFCVVTVSLVLSSSIITKDMIRMPKELSTLDGESDNHTQEPEKFISTENYQYQRIFPPHYHQERTEATILGRSLVPLQNLSALQSNAPSLNSQTTKAQPLRRDFNQSRLQNEKLSKEAAWSSENHNPLSETNIDSSLPATITSPEELSKQFWGKYKHFSSDFLKTSNLIQTSESDVVHDKDHQFAEVGEVLQRLYDCSWSSSILNCLHESFKAQSGPILKFLEPQFPRFHQGGSFFQHDQDIEDSDTDEGRRKLSKKLQLLLPILMMLKMTMLPALAVMALVSGKAFLLSLLSLGVAVVAAFAHPAALGASKRHEIAPHTPPASEHLPSNYYYVM